MDAFISYVNERLDKTTLSPQTKKLYLSRLVGLRMLMKSSAKTLSFVKNIDKVMEVLDSQSLSIGNKRNTFAAIIKVITVKKLKAFYTEKMRTINAKEFEIAGKNQLSTRQQQSVGGVKFTDLGDVSGNILKALKKPISLNEKYVLKQLYVLSLLLLKEQFLPRLDYKDVKVIYTKEFLHPTQNQLLMGEELTMYINTHKNKSKIGSISFVLNKEVAKAIKEWVTFKNDVNTEYLFFNKRTNKPYDSKRFSDLIAQVFVKFFGKRLTINNIRLLRENHIQSNPLYQSLSENDKEALHKQLFHSKSVATRFYRKI